MVMHLKKMQYQMNFCYDPKFTGENLGENDLWQEIIIQGMKTLQLY